MYLNNAVARMAQCLITLMIMPIVGFSGLVLLVADAKATAALCFLIGLSALFVVITIECAATRILKAIQAHPRAFAAELKSQRSESVLLQTEMEKRHDRVIVELGRSFSDAKVSQELYAR